ncbi:hypothetical protein M0804_013665 [Polistes exclamans]|nr:hypothetical protein M0804_013665 [Polistes exclamans]
MKRDLMSLVLQFKFIVAVWQLTLCEVRVAPGLITSDPSAVCCAIKFLFNLMLCPARHSEAKISTPRIASIFDNSQNLGFANWIPAGIVNSSRKIRFKGNLFFTVAKIACLTLVSVWFTLQMGTFASRLAIRRRFANRIVKKCASEPESRSTRHSCNLPSRSSKCITANVLLAWSLLAHFPDRTRISQIRLPLVKHLRCTVVPIEDVLLDPLAKDAQQ